MFDLSYLFCLVYAWLNQFAARLEKFVRFRVWCLLLREVGLDFIGSCRMSSQDEDRRSLDKDPETHDDVST